MKRTVTITTAHLVAALSTPWSVSTCLIAQAAGGPARVVDCGGLSINYNNGDRGWILTEKVREIQGEFDRLDQLRKRSGSSKDLCMLSVAQLAAKLPFTFEEEVAPGIGRRHVTVTKEHLAVARSVPWSNNTCLLAQALGGPEVVGSCGMYAATLADGRTVRFDAQKAQRLFDDIHRTGLYPNGSSRDKDALNAELEAMLPLSFEATFTKGYAQ